MLTIQNYVKAKTLDEAYELNQARNSRVMGGMMWMRLGNARVKTVIDLSELELNKIEETDHVFKIGAMCTLRQLETHQGLNEYSKGNIAKALSPIVGVQFRNQATVGGSIFGRYGFSDVLTVLLAMDTFVELYNGGTANDITKRNKLRYREDILDNIGSDELIANLFRISQTEQKLKN